MRLRRVSPFGQVPLRLPLGWVSEFRTEGPINEHVTNTSPVRHQNNAFWDEPLTVDVTEKRANRGFFGLRCLFVEIHTVEVVGSNPAAPTILSTT